MTTSRRHFLSTRVLLAIAAITVAAIVYSVERSRAPRLEPPRFEDVNSNSQADARDADGIVIENVADRLRAGNNTSPPVYGFRVVRSWPHDPRAFSQGLVIDGATLYEGTGLRGESTLRRVDLASGKVLQARALDGDHFGEGIAVWKDRIYQLTWTAGLALVYDKRTFEPLGAFRYKGEGWGLTFDGKSLIMSDGSARLTFRDPSSFKTVRHVDVTAGGGPVADLNELEYIDGFVFANVWKTDHIAVIRPETGEVRSWIDLTDLYPRSRWQRGRAVLNGIAWDAKNKRLLVTGKLWPRIYEIRLVRRP